jgi:hypothetical protein
MNQEMYEEPGAAKRTRPNRLDQSHPFREFKAQEMIDILKRSGYVVKKIDRGACGPLFVIGEVFLMRTKSELDRQGCSLDRSDFADL